MVLVSDNSDLFSGRARVRADSSCIYRGDNPLSIGEVERLVAIGSEVERLREERKKKRAQFKNLYNKFRKDVEKYVQYEVSYSEEENKICGRSSTTEDLMSLGLKVPQPGQGQMVLETSIRFDL